MQLVVLLVILLLRYGSGCDSVTIISHCPVDMTTVS